MIYKQFLDIASKLYITFIHKTFEGDTFFPQVNFEDWRLIEEEKHEPDGNLDFSFTYTIFERKR